MFFEVSGPVWTCSDLFGCVRMHPDASRCVRMRPDTFGKLRKIDPIDRSIAQSDPLIRSIRYIFRFFCHVGELEICLASKFQPCTTLGDRKIAEKPKLEFSEFFGSVGSVFRSVRSIWRPRVVVDRSAYANAGFIPNCLLH